MQYEVIINHAGLCSKVNITIHACNNSQAKEHILDMFNPDSVLSIRAVHKILWWIQTSLIYRRHLSDSSNVSKVN